MTIGILFTIVHSLYEVSGHQYRGILVRYTLYRNILFGTIGKRNINRSCKMERDRVVIKSGIPCIMTVAHLIYEFGNQQQTNKLDPARMSEVAPF